MAKVFFLRGASYLRYDTGGSAPDAGYPKAMADGWSGLGGTGFEQDVDTVLDIGNGKAYLFKGDSYLRVDQAQNAVDGEVTSIAEQWGGFGDAGFGDSLDAAVNLGNGKAYLFKGDQYIEYDIAADSVTNGAPMSIAADWGGFADAGFADSIDAAVNWGNGKVYAFKGDAYLRYDITNDVVDDGYPSPIAGNWGFDGTDFASSIDAIWVKLTASQGPGPGPVPVGAGLQPGDHVWYWNGKVSPTIDIPRTSWFPGSTSETDFKGNGDAIFNFVIHANGEIRRGRPHMRNREGTHAWLNNNPGNITGRAGGANWGQYQDKFNWHNFLIFPSYQAGFDGIAKFLLGSGYPAKTRGARQWPAGRYRDLGITEAFHRYAPEDDGNNPEAYGAEVAAAAGVPASTLISDLTPDQMLLMQRKIEQIEGTVEGVILTKDSPELPPEIRTLL